MRNDTVRSPFCARPLDDSTPAPAAAIRDLVRARLAAVRVLRQA
jgi:hypothetical protein